MKKKKYYIGYLGNYESGGMVNGHLYLTVYRLTEKILKEVIADTEKERAFSGTLITCIHELEMDGEEKQD